MATKTLLPHILEALSQTKTFAESYDMVYKNVKSMLKTLHDSRYFKASVYFDQALRLGSARGILLMGRDNVRVAPGYLISSNFKGEKKKKERTETEGDSESETKGREKKHKNKRRKTLSICSSGSLINKHIDIYNAIHYGLKNRGTQTDIIQQSTKPRSKRNQLKKYELDARYHLRNHLNIQSDVVDKERRKSLTSIMTRKRNFDLDNRDYPLSLPYFEPAIFECKEPRNLLPTASKSRKSKINTNSFTFKDYETEYSLSQSAMFDNKIRKSSSSLLNEAKQRNRRIKKFSGDKENYAKRVSLIQPEVRNRKKQIISAPTSSVSSPRTLKMSKLSLDKKDRVTKLALNHSDVFYNKGQISPKYLNYRKSLNAINTPVAIDNARNTGFKPVQVKKSPRSQIKSTISPKYDATLQRREWADPNYVRRMKLNKKYESQASKTSNYKSEYRQIERSVGGANIGINMETNLNHQLSGTSSNESESTFNLRYGIKKMNTSFLNVAKTLNDRIDKLKSPPKSDEIIKKNTHTHTSTRTNEQKRSKRTEKQKLNNCGKFASESKVCKVCSCFPDSTKALLTKSNGKPNYAKVAQNYVKPKKSPKSISLHKIGSKALFRDLKKKSNVKEFPIDMVSINDSELSHNSSKTSVSTDSISKNYKRQPGEIDEGLQLYRPPSIISTFKGAQRAFANDSDLSNTEERKTKRLKKRKKSDVRKKVDEESSTSSEYFEEKRSVKANGAPVLKMGMKTSHNTAFPGFNKYSKLGNKVQKKTVTFLLAGLCQSTQD